MLYMYILYLDHTNFLLFLFHSHQEFLRHISLIPSFPLYDFFLNFTMSERTHFLADNNLHILGISISFLIDFPFGLKLTIFLGSNFIIYVKFLKET